MPPACTLAPSLAAAWAEMVAPLANMAEAALAVMAGVSGGDPGRAEGDGAPSGARGDRVCPPVDPDAGPRAHRVHRPPVRAGRDVGPAGLAGRRHRGDRRLPGSVQTKRQPP